MSTCSGITIRGQPCKRKALKKGVFYCHSHISQESKPTKPKPCEEKNKKCKFVGCVNHVDTHVYSCEQHLPVLNMLEKPDDCPICFDSMTNVKVPLSCGHWVHRECQIKHKNTCCICRQPIILTEKEKYMLRTIEAERRAETEREHFQALRREEERVVVRAPPAEEAAVTRDIQILLEIGNTLESVADETTRFHLYGVFQILMSTYDDLYTVATMLTQLIRVY